MTYEYKCHPCRVIFDVVKRASEMERPEVCPECKAEAQRQFLPSQLYLSKTRVTHPEFNPAFGKVIENRAHLRDEVKRHEDRTGDRIVEIGNDYGSGEKLIAHQDKKKRELIEESWRRIQVEVP